MVRSVPPLPQLPKVRTQNKKCSQAKQMLSKIDQQCAESKGFNAWWSSLSADLQIQTVDALVLVVQQQQPKRRGWYPNQTTLASPLLPSQLFSWGDRILADGLEGGWVEGWRADVLKGWLVGGLGGMKRW